VLSCTLIYYCYQYTSHVIHTWKTPLQPVQCFISINMLRNQKMHIWLVITEQLKSLTVKNWLCVAIVQHTINHHDHSLNWNSSWYQLAKTLNNLILIQMYQIFTDQKASETQIVKQCWNVVSCIKHKLWYIA